MDLFEAIFTIVITHADAVIPAARHVIFSRPHYVWWLILDNITGVGVLEVGLPLQVLASLDDLVVELLVVDFLPLDVTAVSTLVAFHGNPDLGVMVVDDPQNGVQWWIFVEAIAEVLVVEADRYSLQVSALVGEALQFSAHGWHIERSDGESEGG